MFKSALFASALLLVAGTAIAADEMKASDAEGVWQSDSGGYVEIYEEGGTYKGTIVGSKSGEARYDKNNPDEEKKGRRLLGSTILTGLEYAGEGKFEGGEIYSPDNGKTYKAKATQTAPDKLDVRGYMGISLIGKSQTWTRVEPGAPNVHKDMLHNAGSSASKSE